MLGNVELLLLVVTLAGASIIWSTLRLGISPMPTSSRVLKMVLSVIPADLSGEVIELGAGWGTLAWAVSRQFPRSRVVAWEASPVPFAFCWLRSKVQRRPNLVVRFGNFRDADLASIRQDRDDTQRPDTRDRAIPFAMLAYGSVH